MTLPKNDIRRWFGYPPSRGKGFMYTARTELFEATPIEVWREYAANGYTWAKAVDEELSYAETTER
jgi:hypothetical protein